MKTSFIRTVAPVIEPITLADAKAQARILDSNSDGLIRSYLVTAREEAEEALGYGLLTQTWRYDLSEWAEIIPLPMALKLQSITSVKYYDGDGTLQTLSSSYYTTDTSTRPVCLVRASDYAWPTLQADRNTGKIQITYVVGWTTADDVPERIKHGIRLYLTYLEGDRDGTAIFGNVALADKARESARACWTDRVYHLEPSCV